MPFSAGSGITETEADYLTERVRTGLIETKDFDVITNDQVQTLLKAEEKKQKLGGGKCADDSCYINLGRALECEKMLVGKVSGAFEEFTITVRVLNVSTQIYEKSKDIMIKNKKDLPDAAREIVKDFHDTEQIAPEPVKVQTEPSRNTTAGRKSFPLMVVFNALLPGAGHYYADYKRGYVYAGVWAATGGFFLWTQLNYVSKRDTYQNATQDFDATYDSYRSASKLRGYTSYVFLCVYLAVMIDTFFFTEQSPVFGKFSSLADRLGANTIKFDMRQSADRLEAALELWRF